MPVKGWHRRPDLLPRGPTRDDNGFAVGSVRPTTISNSRSWLIEVVNFFSQRQVGKRAVPAGALSPGPKPKASGNSSRAGTVPLHRR
jgi:hypothetical protein